MHKTGASFLRYFKAIGVLAISKQEKVKRN
jgi:hypothetical protein